MIHILFGEMGAGKNHVGELVARHLGCPFFDGDTVIPEAMAKRIRGFGRLTKGDIDGFVRDHLIPAIWDRAVAYDHVSRMSRIADLVVAQALYRRANREEIALAMRGQARFIEVRVPSILTHMRRLLGRERGLRWAMYALVSKPFFQRDKGGDVTANGVGSNLDGQIRMLVGDRGRAPDLPGVDQPDGLG
jgi:gluconate kinase